MRQIISTARFERRLLIGNGLGEIANSLRDCPAKVIGIATKTPVCSARPVSRIVITQFIRTIHGILL